MAFQGQICWSIYGYRLVNKFAVSRFFDLMWNVYVEYSVSSVGHPCAMW